MSGPIQLAKGLLRKILPTSVVDPIAAVRERRLSHALNAQWNVRDLSTRLYAAIGPRVLAGPFAGLVIPSAATAEHLGPYLLGVYESELHDTLAALRTQSFARIINVGAKFGYYSVGLAKYFNAPVWAFDLDPWARGLTRETAELNGVGHLVTVEGRCRPEVFADLPPNTLIVVDCDGCEMQLFAPPAADLCRDATIIVEVHELVEGGAGDTLRRWLETTHRVTEIPSSEVRKVSPVELTGFSEEERALATVELRPHQSWLVCVPLARTT